MPILGKALETVIVARLYNETKINESMNQHGSRTGKSTQTAISSLVTWHRECKIKHTVAVLLDITGAFDNLEWEILFKDLTKAGSSRGTKEIIKSYLHGRIAKLNFGGAECKVSLTKGCPQGSPRATVVEHNDG